jgi:tetratricopeptide (TPR) repeat protein
VIEHLGYHQDFTDQAGKQARNLALLERDLAERPDDAMAMFHYGEALGLGGRIPEAVEAYRKALANPRMPRQNAAVAYRGLANGLLRLKDFTGALEACRAAEAEDAGYAAPRLLAAMALSRMGRQAEAIESLDAYVRLSERSGLSAQRVLEHEADFAFALALKGDCLLTLGRRPEAEAAFREAVRRQPDSPEGHLGLGRIAALRGDHAEAVRAFRKAKTLFRELPHGHLAMAESHAAQRQWGEVLAALGPFLEAEPAHPRGLALRAEALLHLGYHAEAEQAFRDVLVVDPNPDAHLALACLAETRGEMDTVDHHCQEAVAKGGEDPRIFFLLGKCCMRRGEGQQAEAHLLEAMRRAPETPEIYETLTALALDRGDVPKAAAHCRRLLELVPQHAFARRAIRVLEASAPAA